MSRLEAQADEAQDLLERILIDAPRKLEIDLYRIGNGELVPRINRCFYIWNDEEWEKYAAERFARSASTTI